MVTTANIAGGTNGRTTGRITAQPGLHQKAAEIQRYGTVTPMLPLDLEEQVRLEMTEQLNQVVARAQPFISCISFSTNTMVNRPLWWMLSRSASRSLEA
jgi:hypothetical protein